MKFHLNLPLSRAATPNAAICLTFHSKKAPPLLAEPFSLLKICNSRRPLAARIKLVAARAEHRDVKRASWQQRQD